MFFVTACFFKKKVFKKGRVFGKVATKNLGEPPNFFIRNTTKIFLIKLSKNLFFANSPKKTFFG